MRCRRRQVVPAMRWVVFACVCICLAAFGRSVVLTSAEAAHPAAAAQAQTQTQTQAGGGANNAHATSSNSPTADAAAAASADSAHDSDTARAAVLRHQAAEAQIRAQAAGDSAATSDATAAASSESTAAGSTSAADESAAAAKQAEDARELKYVVGLLSAMPAAPSPVPSGARTIIMTSKSGSKFRCTIPHPSASGSVLGDPTAQVQAQADVPVAGSKAAAASDASAASTAADSKSTPVAGAGSKSTATAPVTSKPAAAPAKPVDPAAVAQAQRALELAHIPSLIRKHLGSGCFSKQVDYWTYELCPFRKVRQYHRSAETQQVSTEFGLGSYTAMGDVVQAMPGGGSASLPPMTYVQLFEGGTANRQSKVTFSCNPDTTGQANLAHLLVAVREPKPFHYEFEVKTTLLCRDAEGRLGGIGAIPEATPVAGSHAARTAATTAAVAGAATESVETGRLHSSPRSRSGGAASASAPGAAPQVLDLLEPLGAQCLYLNTGWWTYKLCYLKEITQFHREQVAVPLPPAGTVKAAQQPGQQPQQQQQPPAVKLGARSAAEAAANLAAAAAQVQTKLVTTAEFVLGRVPQEEPLEALERDAQVVRGDSWESTYVSQHYRDGTVCDLNNRPRMTETRIYCDLHEQASVIKSVVESATCEYIVVVHTPVICAHPLFKPDIPKVVEITCEPLQPMPVNAAAAINLATIQIPLP